MSFQDIKPIEKAQHYLDVAFRRAAKLRPKNRKRLTDVRSTELKKISIIHDVINSRLREITDSFPRLDEMNQFYSELTEIVIDQKKMVDALKKIDEARRRLSNISSKFRQKTRKKTDVEYFPKLRRAYIGRTSSIIEPLDEPLAFLEEARKKLKEFPVIKEIFTVCISGFPNVGKTTLLSKLTDSTPEIKNYAFTTKRLNLGYSMIKKQKVQFIDTPGTLARLEKMNNIEKQAYLGLKHLANLVIYVFDPTETYPLDYQEKLFLKIKGFKKPVIVFISKSDLVSQERRQQFLRDYDGTADINVLRKKIAEQLSNNKN